MDSLPQVLLVFPSTIGVKVMEQLTERLSFVSDVWYWSPNNKCENGARVSNVEKVVPHHNSYSLVVYLDRSLPTVNHNLFVEELFIVDHTRTVDSIVNEITRRIKKFERLRGTGDGYGTVVVFDLDETIINRENELLHPAIRSMVSAIANRFTYRVLWSHGDAIHVHRQLARHSMEHLWDVILVRPFDAEEKPGNKSLGRVLKSLNTKFGVWGFSWSVLFDDLEENSVGDYDEHLVVPLNQSPSFYAQWYQKALDWVDNKICNIDRVRYKTFNC